MKTLISIAICIVSHNLFAQVMVDSIRTITNGSWPLYKEPLDQEPMRILNSGDSVTILGYDVDRFYVRTRYPNRLIHRDRGYFITGYIIVYGVDGHDSLKQAATEYREQRIKEMQAELQKILQKLTAKYGSRNAKRIMNHEYWIGMTKDMAIISLGEPDDINRTVTSNLIREQWIYGRSLYLYFENGILTSFQD